MWTLFISLLIQCKWSFYLAWSIHRCVFIRSLLCAQNYLISIIWHIIYKSKIYFLYLISRLLETSILAARMTRLNVWKCGLGVWCYLYGSASVKSPKKKKKKEVKKHLGESEFWQAERKESLLGDWTNKGKTLRKKSGILK